MNTLKKLKEFRTIVNTYYETAHDMNGTSYGTYFYLGKAAAYKVILKDLDELINDIIDERINDTENETQENSNP